MQTETEGGGPDWDVIVDGCLPMVVDQATKDEMVEKIVAGATFLEIDMRSSMYDLKSVPAGKCIVQTSRISAIMQRFPTPLSPVDVLCNLLESYSFTPDEAARMMLLVEQRVQGGVAAT